MITRVREINGHGLEDVAYTEDMSIKDLAHRLGSIRVLRGKITEAATELDDLGMTASWHFLESEDDRIFEAEKKIAERIRELRDNGS